MKVRGWYEADALTADLTVHRHTMMGRSEGEIESRLRVRYSGVVAVLVTRTRNSKSREGGAMK
jgi:hypothetical protein